LEQDCHDYFQRIDDYGGVLPAIEAGFFQREIAEASYRYHQEASQGERILVGVNEFVSEATPDVPLLEIDREGEHRHVERLERVKAERDSGRAERCLQRLEEACTGDENVMPYLIEAAHAYCTLGEICGVMRKAYGEYHPATLV
jgi:methylmalonyl-CoA mutase N-terminal domain/subunit